MAQKQPNEPDRGEPLPGVIPGDEVYVRGKTGPVAGSVVCHGKHGATIKIGEAQHRVPWRHVLGHKRRASLTYQIDEEGEDGMLVRDPQGRRHYVAIPPEAREEKMVIKSLTGGSRLVVLAKAIAPRAGLTEKQVTDKNGVQTTRWVRNTPDMPAPELGHHVGFENGEHRGHGHVMAAGRDGVTVQGQAGGVHRVPHANVTHRWEGPGKPTASPHPAAEPQQAAGASAAATGDALFAPGELDHLPAKVNQPHKTWDDLVKAGTEGLEQFRGQLGKVASAMGLKSGMKPEAITPEQWNNDEGFLFIAPLKGAKRAHEKVEADYGGDYSQLRDMVRGTISVPTMGHVKQALAHIKEAGLELAMKPKDRFAKPTNEGYRDLMTFVKLPNGMVAELQIHVKAMTLAKEEWHAYYETTRSLQAKYNEDAPSDKWRDEDHTKFYDALKAQKDIYGKAWQRAIGSPDDAGQQQGAETMQKSLGCSKMVIVLRGN